MKFFLHNVPSVFLMSLVLLANAQKSSNNLRDVDFQELARQNKITTQILEAFIQKKLGLASPNYRAPSIFDILPGKKPEDRPIRQSMHDRLKEPAPEDTDNDGSQDMNDEVEQEVVEVPEYTDFDALQSVESEQIDSIYSEGRSKKYSSQSLDADLEPSYHCSSCNEDDLGVTRWTMPLLKSGEKRYYLGIFFKANWFKAQQYCRFHGMHLASISSQEENDRLEKYVRESGYGREHFWTSGTDLAEEGNFFWMANGRPLTFVNWNAGEPNNFRYENGEEENCLELWNRDDKGLKWNDSPCSFETYFICEVRSD
ncbi:C-type lectin domain family 4 member F-like isoform X1 [Zerene cesonia]|uniref:C-type lectin domain family 4 member F-like isoform X1 n=1 Tax=Zerene cesonia TaxID=33412 RepID=UPI0018E4EB44|nr:C-type lectin domain family 4 member F-like isoform X1 [Zerene cesonia]